MQAAARSRPQASSWLNSILLCLDAVQAQHFQRAVEEAREVQDRREGAQPATDHKPVDFLSVPPGWTAADMEPEDEYDIKVRPLDTTEPLAEEAGAITAESSLALLRAMAAGCHHAQVSRRSPVTLQLLVVQRQALV